MLITPKAQIELDNPISTSEGEIIGYDFTFADWSGRFQKERDEGTLVDIDSDVSINKQSIQSVESGIYHKELGDLPDTDKDIREFSCDCGELHLRIFENVECPKCHTICRSRFCADIKRVGWINLGTFPIINPNAYEMLGKVIGLKNLQKILSYDIEIDLDGNLRPANQNTYTKNGTLQKPLVPFANIGMIEFRNRFEEVVSHYADLRGAHADAKYLIEHKDTVFSCQIPVSSIYLRPTFTSTKKRSVSFDKINSVYVKILSNASLLRRTMKKAVELKRALNVLFDIQVSLNELYVLTIRSKLSGKNKLIRGSILGNRMNFSSRMVIRSFVGPYAGMDKVEISYKAFLELNLLEIINALMRGYGDPKFTTMTVYEVQEYITKCQYKDEIDPCVWDIMQLFLKKRPHNPLLVNRPPTLDLGSIQYFEIARITPDARDKTLALPLSSLPAMNADFDGDNLSCYAPKEKCVIEAFCRGLSPRYLVVDRTGDTYFNSAFGLIKDEYTNLISLLS